MRISHSRIASFAATGLVPLWLGFAVMIGGSSQPNQLSHLLLQFVGGIIAMACFIPAVNAPRSRTILLLSGLCSMLILWIVVQTLPLSKSVWSVLPDRSVIVEGWTYLGLNSDKAFPISFMPFETRTALLGFVPPVATLLLMLAIGRKKSGRTLYWVIPILGAVSALLGVAQVTTNADAVLRWHAITNPTFATGVFANVNHQSTLCLMCIPMTAALGARLRRDWEGGDDDVGKAAIVGGLLLTNLVGVLAAGSVAGYSLLLPILLFSFILFARTSHSGERGTRTILALSTATFLGSIALVASSPMLERLGVTSFEDGDLSRIGVWRTSSEIAETHLFVGTGLGTFTETYRLYEPDGNITNRFVNNAHNDYLQTLIELGIPGMLIIAAVIGLFLVAFVRTWMTRDDEEYRFRRAAAVAVFVPILHSFVDYPLRTPAIACLAVACLVLMLAPLRSKQRSTVSGPSEPRPGHAVI